jgi:preprotein translocase subunit Sec61beta
MPRDKKGEGFHSAAGLIRYFDQEDDKAIPVSPWAVVALAIVTAVVVSILEWQFA